MFGLALWTAASEEALSANTLTLESSSQQHSSFVGKHRLARSTPPNALFHYTLITLAYIALQYDTHIHIYNTFCVIVVVPLYFKFFPFPLRLTAYRPHIYSTNWLNMNTDQVVKLYITSKNSVIKNEFCFETLYTNRNSEHVIIDCNKLSHTLEVEVRCDIIVQRGCPMAASVFGGKIGFIIEKKTRTQIQRQSPQMQYCAAVKNCKYPQKKTKYECEDEKMKIVNASNKCCCKYNRWKMKKI